MLRRISVLLLSGLLMLALAGSVALAEPPEEHPEHPEGKGACDNAVNDCASEDKVKGKPYDPNAWGSVASQLGDEGVMGAHSSDPIPFVPGRETPRDGLGNVSRNDAGDEGTNPKADTGDTVADHACIAAANPLPGFPDVQPDCTAEPGKSA